MSQHIALSACQILRLNALARACEHLEGAKLSLRQSAQSFFGSIDLSQNPVLKGIPHYGTNLHLRFTAAEGQSARTPTIDANGVITNGRVDISMDGDYRSRIETVIGKDGSRLRDYYNREVLIDTLRDSYGDNIAFRKWDEVQDGLIVPQLEGTATDEAVAASPIY